MGVVNYTQADNEKKIIRTDDQSDFLHNQKRVLPSRLKLQDEYAMIFFSEVCSICSFVR